MIGVVSDVVLAGISDGCGAQLPHAGPQHKATDCAAEDSRVPERRRWRCCPARRSTILRSFGCWAAAQFGHVYLARQLSLDRLVALKISANRGSEGRTMARLEHQHIVQVFSETVDPDFNQRLLCMQLVPGIGLDKLIGALHAASGSKERGPRTDRSARCSLPAPRPRLGPARSCWRSSTIGLAADGARSIGAARSRSARPDGCGRGDGLVRRRGWPRRSTLPIATACCTATSSRPTSW